MLVLHDEATRLHQTVELLGPRFKKALECPERIEEIFKALQNDGSHSVRILDAVGGAKGSGTDDLHVDPSVLAKLLSDTHDQGYLEHLRTTHEDWVANGLIGEDECVFPECFYVHGMCKPGGEHPPPKDRFARPGYYAFDMSAGIAKNTWVSAHASANLAAVGGRLIASSEPSAAAPHGNNVLALCRPPGHHCTTKLAGGYCYINNAVVAVESLRHHRKEHASGLGSPKMAILDVDFHHGNGTQAAFYDDPSVLYVSIHGQDEYPYFSGAEDEVGEGRGHGYNVNLPLAADSPIDAYLGKLDMAIQKMQEFGPSHMLVSLGFDTFFLDPMGCFDLHALDYKVIARRVRQAEGLKDIPSLILLEGGYVVERLGENMLQFLKGWEEP